MGRLWRGLVGLGTRVESLWSLFILLTGAGFFAWLSNQWEALAVYGWPAIAIVSIAGGCLLTISLSLGYMAVSRLLATRRAKEQSFDDLEVIVHGLYANETVQLDGKKFVQCRFDNVTFNYNGGLYQLVDCLIGIPVFVTSDSLHVTRAFELFSHVIVIDRTETVDGRGRKRVDMRVNIREDHPSLVVVPRQQPSIEQKTPP